MNRQTLNQITFAATIIATVVLLSSCGTQKSSHSSTTLSSVNPALAATQKILTSCQKTAGTEMSVNISAVKNASGSINLSLVKIKFNRLSATATQAGNTIRFFKWKVSGDQAYMDQNALQATRYELSSGNVNDSGKTSLTASTITTTNGYYIDLNDTDGSFQVLKAVVYSSSGSIVTQQNILIPQFQAIPADYATNADGSARAQILQDMHPLRNTDTTGWTTQNFADYFAPTCF
jgi:hypothetical protein